MIARNEHGQPVADNVLPSTSSSRWKPGRFRSLLALAWLALWALALIDKGSGPWLLERLGIWRVQVPPVAVLQYERSHPSSPIWGLGDIDGDGLDELVESTGPALLAYDHTDGVHRTLFEVELPAGWSWLDGRGKFGPLIDFDGDGRAEIPLTLHADDRRAWRLLIVDPLARTNLLDVPLPVGQDRRREPYWDGHYTVVDTMTVAGGRLALIVFCSVFYDGLGRAVLAVDARSGEILWWYDLGPQLRPQRETFAIGTLPGHPGRVIVLGTNSPANLEGLQVGGFSDDQARLFVLDAAGQKLWSARLDSLFAVSEVRLVDLGGDGQRSIITCTLNRNQTDPARLTVWDPATRSAVFTETQASAYVGLTVLPGPRLVTMVDHEELREYAPRHDGGLVGRTIRRYPAGTMISREMASGLPGSRRGPWYVVASRDGTVHLHDQRHRVLGRFASPVPNAHPDQFASWRSGASSRLVFQADRALVAMDLQDNTAAWTAALVGGWILALSGALGILRVAGRRRRDLAALRRILARRLAEVAHRDFRMVRDILEFPAFLRDRDAMQLDGYRSHIEQLRRDLVETTIPHLLETLLELESAGYSPPGVGSTRRQLRAARSLLEDERSFQALVDPDSQPSRRYHHLSQDIYADFDRLYRDLHPLVCIDGAQVVQTMLTRRSPDLRAAGVSLQRALPDSAPQTPVLADPAQLGFIIDGLVANAVRAMAGCDGRRRLAVTWKPRRNFVDLLVEDTGVGIAPEDQERIFTAGVESGSGSGFGLRRSREILRQWGGDLTVAASEPGRGATMCLCLRVFLPPRTP